MDVYDRLAQLDVVLRNAAAPVASYSPFNRTGNLLFLSGHLARRVDGVVWAGRLGEDMSLEEGQDAARAVAVDLLSTMQAATGDLNRITNIVKLTAMVHCSAAFASHHLVANGASDLLAKVFSHLGPHARSAFGVLQLPLGACLEVELTAETVG